MHTQSLIAANFRMDPMLKSYFEEQLGGPVDVFYKETTGKKNVNSFGRHYGYFIVALKTFIYRNRYQSIIFWQQFIGLYYGMFTRLFFFLPSNPKTIILTLIYNKRLSLKGRLYRRWFRFMMNARSIHYVVCHTTYENLFYQRELNIKSSKIVFAKVGEGEAVGYDPKFDNDIYFFSGGGSIRDYPTLIEAFKGTNYKLKVACQPSHIRNIKIPSNVEIISHAWNNDFDELIKGAYAIIIPIINPEISAGQLVLIKGMRMSKPAIVTAGNCLKDYADNNFTISVKDHAPEEIRNAVKYLTENRTKRDEMAEEAFKLYQAEYTRKHYVMRACEILHTMPFENEVRRKIKHQLLQRKLNIGSNI